MKDILINVGSQLLRSALAAQAQEGGSILSAFLPAAPAPRAAPMPDYPYLARVAQRWLKLVAIGATAMLFFALGLVMTLGAFAQSYDLFGVFVGSSVFYTGLLITLIGGTTVLACISRARKIVFSWDLFFRGTALTASYTDAQAIAESAVVHENMAANSSVAPAPMLHRAAHPEEETGRPTPERMAS